MTILKRLCWSLSILQVVYFTTLHHVLPIKFCNRVQVVGVYYKTERLLYSKLVMMDEIELRNSYGQSCLTNIKNFKKHSLKTLDSWCYFKLSRNG
jgi:hypothetical protein